MYRHALWLLLPVVCLGQPSSYTISTVAGNNSLGPGFSGDLSAATSAQLNTPIGIALDSSRNLYIADSANERIRKVAGGNISTVVGSNGIGYYGDGGAATSATLYSPYGVWLDSQNNMYIADLSDQVIRKVTSGGTISTFAGNNAPGYSGDGGPATSATMTYPSRVVGDNNGNLYISDTNDNRVRRVAADGTMTTYAGNGVGGYGGDGGQATKAAIHAPYGLAMDAAGNLYIADSQNNRIRRVAPDGTITTVAGGNGSSPLGDGGPATSAHLNQPWGVAVDASGSILIADYGNSRIRRVTPDGAINTIAGTGNFSYSGDGGPATSAKLNFPTDVVVDKSNGQVYIADSSNNVIRLLTPSAPAISGGGVVTASAFGGSSTIAPGSWIEIYGSSLSLSDRSWATGDFSGNTAPTNLDGTTVTIGGQSAFIDYASGGQVNVQVPSNVAAGSQTLVVKTPAGTTANYSVTVNSTQPGLLAPASFKINGTQYVTALFGDGTTYVLPAGAISGVPSRAAKVGDTITIYGVGFGPVSPAIAAGQIVTQSNSLTTPLQFFIGGTQAAVSYYGLSPNYVGLYQFNLTIPSVATGYVPLTFNLGGTAGTQTLYIPVQ